MSVAVLHADESKVSGSRVATLTDDLYKLFLAKPAASPPEVLIPGLPPATAPTGCSRMGVTKTIIAIGGIDGEIDRLKAAMARSKAVAEIASSNNNAVHYVFLGGAVHSNGTRDERVVDWLVRFKNERALYKEYHVDHADHVHFIAGPREILELAAVVGRSGTMTEEYLLKSKIIECLGQEDMDGQGADGTWFKCTSTASHDGNMVGKLPGTLRSSAGGMVADWIDPQDPVHQVHTVQMTLIEWKTELNKRWTRVVQNALTMKQGSPNELKFWCTLGVEGKLDAETAPAAGLQTASSGAVAVFGRGLQPFGSIERTWKIQSDGVVMSKETWIDVAAYGDSLYWSVHTYCFTTMNAMNESMRPYGVANMRDPSANIADLQYDVKCTLSSLVGHSESAVTGSALNSPAAPPWATYLDMRGKLGPCVCGGREGKEVLRVIYWTMPKVATGIVMLLPQMYITHVLGDRNTTVASSIHLGARAVTGFLVLNDENSIPLRLPGTLDADPVHAIEAMGMRLWKVSPSHMRSTHKDGCAKVDVETVQLQRVSSEDGRTCHVAFTHLTVADPFAGLRVCWKIAPSSEPTLDIDDSDYSVQSNIHM